MNIVAIALTYHSLSDLDKKERAIFVAVGIAIMYMLTSVIYWISTKNVASKDVAENAKNVITFLCSFSKKYLKAFKNEDKFWHKAEVIQ